MWEIVGGMSVTILVRNCMRIGRKVGFLDLDTTPHNRTASQVKRREAREDWVENSACTARDPSIKVQ